MAWSAEAEVPAATEEVVADERTEAERLADEELPELEEVVVYGTSGKAVAGLTAESELGPAALALYGANTVGDLIGQVAQDVDNSAEGPVILINGRPANGISSVNDLPPEVVQSFQVLPPQAAAALGYSPTRRVINVVLRQSFAQETANVTMRAATAGKGRSADANVSSIRLQGNSIRQFTLRASKTEPLLESDRDILSQPTTMPYDLLGNVVSFPIAGGEIDPNLSALAGTPVTVAGVPTGTADPTLEDFAAQANEAHLSDMGRYRTLLSDQYTFGLNGNWNVPLPRAMSLSMNMNADRSQSVSQTGATSVLLHVPASSPFSPFSQDVGVARYLGHPLEQQNDPWSVNFNGTLNSQLGKWRTLLNSNFSWRESATVSERRLDTSALQSAIDAGTANPFGTGALDLVGDMLTDRATSRGYNAALQLQTSATLFTMPAGPATFSARGELRQSEQRSRTVGVNNVSSRNKRQDELAFASLQVPLFGRPPSQPFAMNTVQVTRQAAGAPPAGATQGAPPPGGPPGAPPGAQRQQAAPASRPSPAAAPTTMPPPNPLAAQPATFGMGAELSGSARDVTVVGTLFDYGYGLNWRWGNRLTMRAGVNHEKVAPQPESLTNPIVTIDDYRTYDFVRQETVLVRYITGGNPDLEVENRRRITFGGTARPLVSVDFTLNAEYQRTIGRDAVSQLPAVSEDVQLAFPDRYVRDAEGRLIEVDARLVSFERTETEQIRWGANFRRAFAVPQVAPTTLASGPRIIINDGSAGDELSGAGWRVNANFTHTWILANKRLARTGLPEQDLLAGGVGLGSSISRHSVQGRFGVGHNGIGMQLAGNWRSRTRITAGTSDDPNDITFSSLLRFDLSAFANLGTVFPSSPLLKDSRVTLGVDNLLDAHQKVRDEDGITPLRYQRYLLDSRGRMVSLSLRKMF
ncbi:MAG TPA: hypothetical protein VNQ32_15915 [Steroidobacteraceae bacterium]|nr:hypothetical protein [Steroidobacteraceae bacterium]